ncbi:tetratricopeptide repeat-containing diguanylate cyclase [Actinoplanes friuliensis]|uniref:Diguanylate cyclase n=1 Tax=Actinoplanes friuliensis DSM 7358 TaxID=1246995 RepID=U5VYZ3_9ACTN|nr:GGDEF domain-containing protein [Actinoplanes friuliensis]AGZ42002.1 diguanylate cyclase [Actinoplanes friuliensis DSM 7358]
MRPEVAATVESLIADIYVRHDGLAGRAAELVATATAAGDRRHADLGRLILAELDNRSGRVDEGVRRARDILRSTDDRLVVAHAHAVIAGGLWRVGDNAAAVRHAYPANRMLEDGDPPALRADHAIILALQVNDQRIGGVSHAEFRAAQELADATGVPALILANLNNWAWCAYTHGDLDAAAELVQRMRAHSGSTGEPLNASCADTVARILLETGRPREATVVIEAAIAGAAPTDSDAIPAALITLADIQRRDGNIGTAMRTLEACREIAARDLLPDVDALALRMLAGCHAELGDFQAAYQDMVDFHEAWTVRRSEQSDVAARVAHAQFAVDEAHRNTERFRDLAERDALTGLWNRRRSDAELDTMLGAGRPAAVALLDLDHFKQVNDTYAHAVGDLVLCRVAEILQTVAGHAGRHGGEEFILILDADPRTAAQTCEAVRAAVAGHDWQAVAPGLRVTTSIGLTTVRPGDDARSVVRRADEHLYAAKHSGRDQVSSDPRTGEDSPGGSR